MGRGAAWIAALAAVVAAPAAAQPAPPTGWDGTNPFVDPEGYRAYVAQKERAFRATLAAQRGAKGPDPAR